MNRPDILAIIAALFIVAAVSHLGGPLRMAGILMGKPAASEPYVEIKIDPSPEGRPTEDRSGRVTLAAPARVTQPRVTEKDGPSEADAAQRRKIRSMAASMPPHKAARFLEALPVSEAAAVLSELPPATAGMILAETSDEGSARLARALAEPVSPTGIMASGANGAEGR
ncbi:magnesium transporter MgtE N-terminal domain-containing protein [Parvularcula lutaonensis]|uniref:Magnesium transporter MgtE N-terminal domain-containing protein n=1 Tax=Parvularcula lutaonensis TaxID=491923 RepID=A0ABV7MCT6_9PROT|nr:hypothetical protein [Parvularcula lutaonensis]GGY51601.1 hypothetical protein GCM10007148_20650 [Parvularcula lutaonensis]